MSYRAAHVARLFATAKPYPKLTPVNMHVQRGRAFLRVPMFKAVVPARGVGLLAAARCPGYKAPGACAWGLLLRWSSKQQATVARQIRPLRHGLRFASTKASAAEASAGGLGIGAKLGLLVGCLGGGGLAFAASQGKTPMEVWEQTIDFFDLVPVEIPETLQHIEQPQIVTPDKHVHPYAAKPWYWKVWFAIYRTSVLFLIILPFIVEYIKLQVFPESSESKEQRREVFCAMVVEALNKGGCTLIKFGQWMSMRPDMFPQDLVTALAKLRDDAPSHSYEFTIKEIEGAFGNRVDDIFVEIAKEPIASGSVAQVHKCVLKEKYALPDGSTTVALKVRHPSALDETYLDMYLIDMAVPIINYFSDGEIVVPFARDTFHETIQRQVDFTWEAYNLIMFITNFAREMQQTTNSIRFPYVSTELLSETILIESWAEGETLDKICSSDALNRLDQPTKTRLADALIEMVCKMFLRDNFIHGDLHSGNVLYDVNTGKITVLDAGLVTAVKEDAFFEFGDFIRALVSQDIPMIAETLVVLHDYENDEKMGKPRTVFDVKLVQKDLEDIFQQRSDKWEGAALAQALGDITGAILNVLPQNGIVLRGDVASSLSTMSLCEGLVMQLDSDFDILKNIVPYFIRFRGWASMEEISTYGYTTSERETKNIKDTMSQAISAVTGDTDAKEATPDAPAQAQAALVPADSDDGRWKPPPGQGGAKE